PPLSPSPPRARGHPGHRARIPGPTPLHNMAGIQALPAQQRTLLTLGGRVIRREDLQLVLRGKRPPPSPRGHLRIGTFPSSARHPPQNLRSRAPGRAWSPSWSCRGSLHPRPRVTNYQGAGASTQVDREGIVEPLDMLDGDSWTTGQSESESD